MKKVYLSLISGFILNTTIFAQSEFRCGHTEVMNELYQQHPEIRGRMEKSDTQLETFDKQAYQEGYKNGYPLPAFKDGATGQNSGVNGTVYVIPVVFHILHLNGIEKIDEAQVKDQMRILNLDYRKKNADTSTVIPVFKPIIGDAEVEFRLATIDPNGKCTNGIVYHEDSKTNWKQGNSSYYTYSGTATGLWDPRKYLNIYVVKAITSASGNSVAGYTYKPGAWSSGAAPDAIVILHEYVGSIGTSSANRSRAITHEIGHWFNLDHPWGGTNNPGVSCTGSDGVSDTPPTKGFTSCPIASPSLYKVCDPNVSENFQNYMDYSYCSHMFTQGQVTRMRNALTSTTAGRNQLWTTTNLTATGVTNPLVCIPKADFSCDKISICTGQTVKFWDDSQNASPTAWSWSFSGGTPATSTDSMPKITYNTAGIYPVTYTATTSAGSNSITKTAYIKVISAVAAYTTQLMEGFETNTIPGNDWSVTNPSGVTWTRINSAAATGTYSAKIDNTQNTEGAVDELISPTIDIQNIYANSGSAVFTFKVAHQQASSNQKDKLQVFSSVNCGQTWTPRYTRIGSALSTAGISATAFTPTSTQWRTETVNCAALAGEKNVMFKFVFTCDTIGPGNNIYLDDINISGASGIEENDLANLIGFNVHPVPSAASVNINFTLDKAYPVSLCVLDVLGKKIEQLENNNLQAGEHQYFAMTKNKWDSGVYVVLLNIGGKIFTQKLIIE